MNKVSITICGEQFFSEANDIEWHVFCDVMRRNKQVNWSIQRIDEKEYESGMAASQDRIKANFEKPRRTF